MSRSTFNPVRWLPALVMMGAIFWFSSRPGDALPDFDWADRAVKKSGHMLGYALLTLTYAYALGLEQKRFWLAWLLAILYAITDEFHQSFVPARHPSAWDVLLFDNLGALLALAWARHFFKQKRPAALADRSVGA